MEDIKVSDVNDLSSNIIEKTGSVLEWFNQPKEEARGYLIDVIKDNSNLTLQEKSSLIYNSRKFTREYANSKKIYEQAKKNFGTYFNEGGVDDDWLHFFFDKAEKVSNESMQVIWAKLLAGEFNKPGSISRKLMHIISIMDVHSARSFQTFSLYVFERSGLLKSYNTEVVMIPTEFYTNSFDFMRKVEKWLLADGYDNYKELAVKLTMSEGELNSLENLGLIQKVQDYTCKSPLLYFYDDNKAVYIKPVDDNDLPLGEYTLTQEGKQLYRILNMKGDKVILAILKNYLLSIDKKFSIEKCQ